MKKYLSIVLGLFLSFSLFNCDIGTKETSNSGVKSDIGEETETGKTDTEEENINANDTNNRNILAPKMSARLGTIKYISGGYNEYLGQNLIKGATVSITFNWNSIDNAKYYKLYRNTSLEGGTDALLSSSEINKTSYTCTQTYYRGTTIYYYWVSVVTDDGESERPSYGGNKFIFTIDNKGKGDIKWQNYY